MPHFQPSLATSLKNHYRMLQFLTLLLILLTNNFLAPQFSTKFHGRTVSDIQASMETNECYLLYEDTHGYLISKNTVKAFKINLDEVQKGMSLIKNEVELFQENPFEHDPKLFQDQTRHLYIQLMRPVEDQLSQRINIIPGDTYAMIPWNALITQKGQYLMNRFEVTIKRSIEIKKKASVKKNRLKMMFLAPQFDGHLTLKSEEEIKRIQKQVGKAKFTLGDCDILHISSHGIVDVENSENSGILMSNLSKTTSAEISEMCIDAELVFLNLCEGAKKSRDQRSIVDAFDQAGAETTIGALWEVDDHMAVQLSSLFYRELLRGQRSGEALRNGLLNYQKNCSLSSELHPIKWAGYQVYGENNEIVEEAYGFNKFLSIVLSMMTSFSLICYYFGKMILSKIRPYSWI